MQDLAKLIENHKRFAAVQGPSAAANAMHNECVAFYNSVIGMFTGDDFLDIGAGQGLDALWFSEQGKRVTAVNLDDSVIRQVSQDGKLFTPVNGDMHDLPLPDNSFDTVMIKHVLEHSLMPFVALSEIRRVLRPGGHAIVIVPPGSGEPLQGHFIPGWNVKQLEYMLVVMGFTPVVSAHIDWNACCFARMEDDSFLRSCFFHDYANTWSPA